MVTMRLLWMLDTVPGLREAAMRNEVMFGCVDSWLLYKLTGQHITEGGMNGSLLIAFHISCFSVQYCGHWYV